MDILRRYRISEVVEDSDGNKYYYRSGPTTYLVQPTQYNTYTTSSSAATTLPASQVQTHSINNYSISTGEISTPVIAYQYDQTSNTITIPSSSGISDLLKNSTYINVNNLLTYEIFTVPGTLHNENGPAIIYKDDSGKYQDKYYLNGKEMSKGQWKLSLSKVEKFI